MRGFISPTTSVEGGLDHEKDWLPNPRAEQRDTLGEHKRLIKFTGARSGINGRPPILAHCPYVHRSLRACSTAYCANRCVGWALRCLRTYE